MHPSDKPSEGIACIEAGDAHLAAQAIPVDHQRVRRLQDTKDIVIKGTTLEGPAPAEDIPKVRAAVPRARQDASMRRGRDRGEAVASRLQVPEQLEKRLLLSTTTRAGSARSNELRGPAGSTRLRQSPARVEVFGHGGNDRLGVPGGAVLDVARRVQVEIKAVLRPYAKPPEPRRDRG